MLSRVSLVLSSLVLSLGVTLTYASDNTMALAPAPAIDNISLFEDIERLAIQCLVLVRGQNYTTTKSVCPELKMNHGNAALKINGTNFYARIVDSAQSDGGDLNDMTVFDAAKKPVALRQNIVAFGDMGFALAGGVKKLIRP